MSTINSNAIIDISDNNLLSKKRTFVQMNIDDDYQNEEEQKRIMEKKERVRLVRETLKKIMEIRRFLVTIGEYDLEDGEILE
jgi:hypothetical protein